MTAGRNILGRILGTGAAMLGLLAADDCLEQRLTRRDLLKGMLAAPLVLAAPFAATAVEASESLSEKGMLYDIQLAAVASRRSAEQERERLRKRLSPLLADRLEIRAESGLYKVSINADAVGGTATAIVNELRATGLAPGAFRRLGPSFFNPSADQGRYALLRVDEEFGETLKEYTTAYGSDGLTAMSAEVRANLRRLGLPEFPKKGDIIPVATRHLKVAFQYAMEEGADFRRVPMDRNVWRTVVENTVGDVDQNMRQVLAFNGISPEQLGRIHDGRIILIPNTLYHDPTKPISVQRAADGGIRVVRDRDISAESREKEAVLEERIGPPSINAADNIRSGNLGVLAAVRMPAVLIEAFNLNNDRQVRFYQDDANLRALAESYARGIIAYKQQQNPDLRRVFIDNGHGQLDPGTVNARLGVKETDFTNRLQRAIGAYLRARGYEVHELDFKGPVPPKKTKAQARIDHFAGEANRHGSARDSVYIAVHVDYNANVRAELPPRIFVEDSGPQPKSTALAIAMLGQAIPAYHERFS